MRFENKKKLKSEKTSLCPESRLKLSFNGISVDLVAVVAGPVALLLASVAVASAVRSPGPDRSLRLGVAAFAGLVGLWSLATAVG